MTRNDEVLTTMVITLKIEVAAMELVCLGSTIISFHQRKAPFRCTLHDHYIMPIVTML